MNVLMRCGVCVWDCKHEWCGCRLHDDQTPDEAAEIIGAVLRARNDRP